MILETRQKLIEIWKAEGIVHIEESIWSSSIQLENLPRVREFLSINGFNYVDISIVRPSDDSSEIMKFRTHYDEVGQCFSNNLKLTVGLEQEIKNQEYQDKTVHIINCLRTIFGVPIARELMLITHFDTVNFYNAGASSELGYASKFDTQNLNFYGGIEYSKLRNVPIDALILLDKAFQQRFTKERFILMWVAFEAIINALPIKGSNGLKRQKYFQDELSSNTVNEEVKRLHEFRGAVFKEAKFIDEQIEEINWSLYAAIQLAIMEDCPQRTAFLKGYERTIIERS